MTKTNTKTWRMFYDAYVIVMSRHMVGKTFPTQLLTFLPSKVSPPHYHGATWTTTRMCSRTRLTLRLSNEPVPTSEGRRKGRLWRDWRHSSNAFLWKSDKGSDKTTRGKSLMRLLSIFRNPALNVWAEVTVTQNDKLDVYVRGFINNILTKLCIFLSCLSSIV